MRTRSVKIPRTSLSIASLIALGSSVVVAGGPALSSAQAATTSSTVVTRMTVAPTSVKDSAGSVFAPRAGFIGGEYYPTYASNVDIAGTNDDALYRPELVRMSGWSQAMTNGTYDVTLKMRESWWNAAGKRVFDVSAEGQPKLTGVDIYQAVGKAKAYDRTFRVDVRDGRLDLGFKAKADGALVSSIVVTRVATSASTPAPSTPAPQPTSPKPTTPKPTTPAPTTPAPSTGSNTNRPSGMLFDSGVYSMNKADVVTSFAQSRGAGLDVLAVFPSRETWDDLQGTWYMDSQRIPANYKGTLNVGLPLFPQDGNLATAASGGYNAQWEKFARNLAAKYPTSYVRIAWEMNIGWYFKATPSNKSQWIAAYRNAVQSMRKAAPGLRFVFNVNEGPGQTGTKDAREFWPGDDVVDIVAIDAYDWDPGYTTDANIANHRDSDYGWNFWLNFAKSKNKKFALPEWGIAPANGNSGGDNPKYINFVYSWLKANAPWIAFESYFQETDGYIRSDLFTGNSPKASAEYKRWMPLLKK